LDNITNNITSSCVVQVGRGFGIVIISGRIVCLLQRGFMRIINLSAFKD
jgi:hypothetical protein